MKHEPQWEEMFRSELTKHGGIARDSPQVRICVEIASGAVEDTSLEPHDLDMEEGMYHSYWSICRMYEFDLKHFP